MNVAVIGASGQLGSDICRVFDERTFIPLRHQDLDITAFSSVREGLHRLRPDAVVNCASFTNVEACERDAQHAYQVNTIGAKNVAIVCNTIGAKAVFISSDYVFGADSQRSEPYTEFDPVGPINVLGRTKAAGEELVRQMCPRHLIVRTSSLFGSQGSRVKGGNFVSTILRLAKERGEVRVVNDQVMSPTYTVDLAAKVRQLLIEDQYGTFHVTNSGSCSWFEFASHIIKSAGIPAQCVPISSSEYPSVVKRPGYSVLGHFHLKLLGMDDMRPWEDAVREYVATLGDQRS
ncbi:MAG: dTDP-4-dehydrorhamnose reductase [Chloroflexi bacterium]|nr:dTDP-4-dehydrorhamnose reductase [Chloroflexota bacterium]